MRSVRFAGAAIATFAALASAEAADMRAPYRLPPPVVQEFGSGWYLRGDVGWVGFGSPTADLMVNGGVAGSFSSVAVEDTWVVGGGFGYKAGFLRVDVTADYRPRALAAISSPGLQAEGNLVSWTTLLNGYVDLGTWSGITPYVGAGIGGAYHEMDSWQDTSNYAFAYRTGWTFAWALMAGAAVQLGPNVALDVGYRYVDLGSAELGYATLIPATVAAPQSNVNVRFGDLDAHEVRVGLRFVID